MTRDLKRLSGLLRRAGVTTLGDPGADPEIAGLELDSRHVTPGDLFCALPGLRVDGASFAPEALERGARAVLSEAARPAAIPAGAAWVQVTDARRETGRLAREWHQRPDEAMTLLGVTGTNGKTSVVHLVDAMARAAGYRTGRMGTISYAFGETERPALRTTPEAPEFFGILAAMRDEGVEVATVEVSSHALALGRVEGARFAVGALLNLSRDHLDFHGDMERYLEAKARLVESLDPGSVAVLPADDSPLAALAERTPARTLTFGRSERAAVRIDRDRCLLTGTEVALETPVGRLELASPLVGPFVPDNLAAAAACSLGARITPEGIVAGARELQKVPGRMERVEQGQPFAVLVDYAHTEHALKRLLAGARQVTAGRVLVVFGCGGNRDRGKRPAMGLTAAQGADRVFLTSDNPRDEEPATILREIESGVASVPGVEGRYVVVPDRAQAVFEAIRAARPGDTVIVAGKGHETTQSFADRTVHLDDREIARESLAKQGWRGGCRAGA